MLNLLVLSEAVHGKDFTDIRVNPGVGGTEYLVIMLATSLAQKFSDLSINVYTKYQFSYDTHLDNLNVRKIESVTELPVINRGQQKWLLTMNVAWELHCENALENLSNIILWSHHPSDWRARFLRKYAYVSVSTGAYQFCSNWSVHSNHKLIPNIFLRKQKDSSTRNTDTDKAFNIMYLGALIPTKGFHLLLKEWSEVCRLIPEAQLHVVGGANLYGNIEGMPNDFPCDPEYAKLLREIITKTNIDVEGIKFYGTLGDERFTLYPRMDVAVINPSGVSESFSFNLHECLDYGMPVIASQDYGLNDVMWHFPEQSITKWNSITKILLRVHDDPSFRRNCQHNAFHYIESFENRNANALIAWRALILGESLENARVEFNLIRFKGYLRAIMIYPKVLLHLLKYHWRNS